MIIDFVGLTALCKLRANRSVLGYQQYSESVFYHPADDSCLEPKRILDGKVSDEVYVYVYTVITIIFCCLCYSCSKTNLLFGLYALTMV
jgi:hypothetical protein